MLESLYKKMKRHVYLNVLTAILIFSAFYCNASQAKYIQSLKDEMGQKQLFDTIQIDEKSNNKSDDSLLVRKPEIVNNVCDKFDDMILKELNISINVRFSLIDDVLTDPCLKAANSLMFWLLHGLIPGKICRRSLAKGDDANWKNLISALENVIGYPIKIDETLQSMLLPQENLIEQKFTICDKITKLFSDQNQNERENFALKNALNDPCNRALDVVQTSLNHDGFEDSRTDKKEAILNNEENEFNGYIIHKLLENDTLTQLSMIIRSKHLCNNISNFFDEKFANGNIRNNLTDTLDDPCLAAMDSIKNWLFDALHSNEQPLQNTMPTQKLYINNSLTRSEKEIWNDFMGVLEKAVGLPIQSESIKNMVQESRLLKAYGFCDRVSDVFEQNTLHTRFTVEDMIFDPCMHAAHAFALYVIHELLPLRLPTHRSNRQDDAKWPAMGKSLKEDIIQTAEFPFIVAYGSGCGGAILNKYWILTAAHCGSQDTKINAGSTKHLKGKTYYIEKHIIHNGWNPHNLDNDFQLLKLKTPLKFDSNIKPIEIGTQQDIKPGEEVTVIGWGKSQETGAQTAEGLLAVDAPILEQEHCKDKLSVTKNMFCAELPSGEKDACQGDSGGPAVINNRLIGVVSFGVGCGRSGYPGVYARVPVAADWIQSYINV